MSASSGKSTRSLPDISSGDQPRRSRSATHDHNLSSDSLNGLRAAARRRSALRWAGPAT